MNKLFHKLIYINFYKNNKSINSTKKSISLPQKQVLKLSTSVSIKSCNNKDNNNKIFYISKNQKIDYKKVKKINFLNQDLTQIPNINPSIKNSFSNKSHKFILCPKKLILKNSNNTLSYREKVKKLRSFANLNSSNSSLFDKKKKKTMSMDSYELEKSKFKKLLFDENICISKKKVNLEYFLKKFNNENFINQLYIAKFND